MKKENIKYIIYLVSFGILALITIQFYHIIELTSRKNTRIESSVANLGTEISTRYNKIIGDKIEDIYIDSKNTLLENVTIKDTTIIYNEVSHPYLVIKASAIDPIYNSRAETNVLFDIKDIDTKKFNTNSSIDEYKIKRQNQDKSFNELFNRSISVNRMVLFEYMLYKYHQINNTIDKVIIDTLISAYINTNEVPRNYMYELHQNNKIISSNSYPKQLRNKFDQKEQYSTQIYLSGEAAPSAELKIYFPYKVNYILKEIYINIILSIGLLILLVASIVLLVRNLFFQDELNSSKNDFISNMSHEFKTPISTISLACQLLEDAKANPEIDQKIGPYVGIIQQENKKLQKLIEEIIQISTSSFTELKLNYREENLIDVLNETIGQYASIIEEKNGTLVVNFPPIEEVLVTIDKDNIEKALAVIIDNAIKYTEDKPHITISLIKKRKISQIIIKDNGIGIEKKHINKIFDKLYRIPKGNLHSVKGFGIGLSFAKSIFDLHNWEIKIKSIFNKGTTVILTIKNN